MQHYVVDYASDKVGQDKGLEEAGIPEGIPSMAEYVAEYCSAAVRYALFVIWILQFISF